MREKVFLNFYKMVVTLLWWLFVVIILSKYYFLPWMYTEEEVNSLCCLISIWSIENFRCAVTWVGSKVNDSSNGQLCERALRYSHGQTGLSDDDTQNRKQAFDCRSDVCCMWYSNFLLNNELLHYPALTQIVWNKSIAWPHVSKRWKLLACH